MAFKRIALFLIISSLVIAGALYWIKSQPANIDPRVQNTVSTVLAINKAFQEFYVLYDSYPGDMQDIDKLPGCQGAEKCFAGNGDGRIGKIGETSITSHMDERVLFWHHLYQANLIDKPQAVELTDGWQGLLPKSGFGGVFHVKHFLKSDKGQLELDREHYYKHGIFLILSSDTSAKIEFNNWSSFLLTGDEAHQLKAYAGERGIVHTQFLGKKNCLPIPSDIEKYAHALEMGTCTNLYWDIHVAGTFKDFLINKKKE